MRCVACNTILKPSEMYTREVDIGGGKTKEVVEDMCTKCRKIIIGEESTSDILEDLALDILQGDWEDYDE